MPSDTSIPITLKDIATEDEFIEDSGESDEFPRRDPIRVSFAPEGDKVIEDFQGRFPRETTPGEMNLDTPLRNEGPRSRAASVVSGDPGPSASRSGSVTPGDSFSAASSSRVSRAATKPGPLPKAVPLPRSASANELGKASHARAQEEEAMSERSQATLSRPATPLLVPGQQEDLAPGELRPPRPVPRQLIKRSRPVSMSSSVSSSTVPEGQHRYHLRKRSKE